MFKRINKLLSLSLFCYTLSGCSFLATHPEDVKEIESMADDAFQTVIRKNADGFPEPKTIRPLK